MTNLPSPRSESKPLSPERVEHRDWIGGRIITLLSHYWREDDPVELTAAIGADWADVLEGLPQKYIQLACIQYQRDEPRRKPTPGAIYQTTMALMPKPAAVPRQLEKTPEPKRISVSMERRREIIIEMCGDNVPTVLGPIMKGA